MKYQEKRDIEKYIYPFTEDEGIRKKRKIQVENEEGEISTLIGLDEENNPKSRGPLAVSTPRQTTMVPPESPQVLDVFSEERHASPIHQSVSPIATPKSFTQVQENSPVVGIDEGLKNLSMPLAEYINGNRPVKLHLPFDQLRQNISEHSDPDSPTIVFFFFSLTFLT